MSHAIKNPEKWIGKYVRHMSNWMEYQYTDDGYCVCEVTGKLIRHADDMYWADYWPTYEEACVSGFDECYSYSHEGMMQLALGH